MALISISNVPDFMQNYNVMPFLTFVENGLYGGKDCSYCPPLELLESTHNDFIPL